MEEQSNGRATIREVYALVQSVEEKIDAVDDEVIRLQEICAQRPAMCALQRECVAKKATDTHEVERWSLLQRYGWMAATLVAVVSGIIGWTN